MRVLKVDLDQRLGMAQLEGQLEGLKGPGRAAAAEKLRNFYMGLIRMTTGSLPTTCIQHGRIVKTDRKFRLRIRCVCALHHDRDAGM